VKLDKIIPEPTAVLREGLIVLGGVLIAAWILSKFPALQSFVASNSVTVKKDDGTILY
jgi:ABC-type transporter Mla subunit MlaD